MVAEGLVDFNMSLIQLVGGFLFAAGLVLLIGDTVVIGKFLATRPENRGAGTTTAIVVLAVLGLACVLAGLKFLFF